MLGSTVGPIRYIKALPRRVIRFAMRVAKPVLRPLLLRSRRLLISLAHRSPWLHARLRRYRHYDHQLRLRFGLTMNVHIDPAIVEASDVALEMPKVWRGKGHNDACKSPLESWFNQ